MLSRIASFVATPPRTDPWVVDDDGGPGVDSTDVQAAVDAAQPGDQILVHAGVDADCVITKGVSVVGLPGELVRFDGFINGLITIRDIPAFDGTPALSVVDSTVLLSQCDLTGGRGGMKDSNVHADGLPITLQAGQQTPTFGKALSTSTGFVLR